MRIKEEDEDGFPMWLSMTRKLCPVWCSTNVFFLYDEDGFPKLYSIPLYVCVCDGVLTTPSRTTNGQTQARRLEPILLPKHRHSTRSPRYCDTTTASAMLTSCMPCHMRNPTVRPSVRPSHTHARVHPFVLLKRFRPSFLRSSSFSLRNFLGPLLPHMEIFVHV